jgi:uncharacterized protein (DUF924 family)
MDKTLEKKWFGAAPEVDTEIRALFKEDVDAAARGEYDSWLESTEEGLAGIILMDQFTRNMYRGTAEMCGHPALSREWKAVNDIVIQHMRVVALLYFMPVEALPLNAFSVR